MKEVIVKVLVEGQQEVHELVFLPGDFDCFDSEGFVVFVDVVFKEDKGVQ